MELAPHLKSRMLERCVTVNLNGEVRPRFIELENYNLWSYLVINKHHLTIRDQAPCLWVSAAEFARKSEIYRHSGEVEPVNRIIISVFHEELGFSTVIERFTHRSDSFKQLNIINAHLEEQAIDPTEVESVVVPGYAVGRTTTQRVREAMHA